MKIFSKVLATGFLLVALPTIPRSHEDRARGSKCITGVYVGVTTITNDTENRPFTFQFKEDGTMIIQFAEGPQTPPFGSTQHEIFGTWKCIGENCFSFCAVESLIATPTTGGQQWAIFQGQLCLDSSCKTGTIKLFNFSDFSNPQTQTKIGSSVYNDFTVYTLICN